MFMFLLEGGGVVFERRRCCFYGLLPTAVQGLKGLFEARVSGYLVAAMQG